MTTGENRSGWQEVYLWEVYTSTQTRASDMSLCVTQATVHPSTPPVHSSPAPKLRCIVLGFRSIVHHRSWRWGQIKDALIHVLIYYCKCHSVLRVRVGYFSSSPFYRKIKQFQNQTAKNGSDKRTPKTSDMTDKFYYYLSITEMTLARVLHFKFCAVTDILSHNFFQWKIRGQSLLQRKVHLYTPTHKV